MRPPCISVIVPVYKVEAYLSQCIDSLLTQTFTDFELLLIDDGSPDNCGDICDRYVKNDNRIKVFHKVNGGPSSARNCGLDNAQGEWIAFVDSDDYVGRDYLKELYEVTAPDVDLVIQSLFHIKNYEGEITNDSRNSVKKWVYAPSDFGEMQKEQHLEFYCQTMSKLFRREFLRNKGIKFIDSVRFGEDYIFLFSCLNVMQGKVCMSSTSNYFYIDRENSLVHGKYSFEEEFSVYYYVRNVTMTFIQKYNCQIDNFDIACYLHRAITMVKSRADLQKISPEDWTFFCKYFKVITKKTALDKWVIGHFYSFPTVLFFYLYFVRSFREALEKRNLWSIVDFLKK